MVDEGGGDAAGAVVGNTAVRAWSVERGA
jgi:hypothetical protein